MYVYAEKSIETGLYLYDKARRDGTRGLLAGDIIGVCGPAEEFNPEDYDLTDIFVHCTIRLKIRFNGLLTTQTNAPVIRAFRQKLGDVDVIEDLIEELIGKGLLDSDFADPKYSTMV